VTIPPGSKWPKLEDRAWVVKHYRKKAMGYKAIASLIGNGCTRNAVAYWVRKHGIRPHAPNVRPVAPYSPSPRAASGRWLIKP